MFCLQRSHTTGSGGSNSLSVLAVLDVTCGVDTFDGGGGGAWLGENVAGLVSLKLVLEHLGGRGVTYGVKQSVDGKVLDFVGLSVFYLQMGQQLAVTFSLQGNGVVEYLQLLVLFDSLLHDGGCSQVVLSDNHVHLGAKLGQEQGLFAGRVTTANNGQWVVSEDRHGTVTHSTGRDTLLPVGVLTWQAQSLGRGTGGDNHSVGSDWLTVLVELTPELERFG